MLNAPPMLNRSATLLNGVDIPPPMMKCAGLLLWACSGADIAAATKAADRIVFIGDSLRASLAYGVVRVRITVCGAVPEPLCSSGRAVRHFRIARVRQRHDTLGGAEVESFGAAEAFDDHHVPDL